MCCITSGARRPGIGGELHTRLHEIEKASPLSKLSIGVGAKRIDGSVRPCLGYLFVFVVPFLNSTRRETLSTCCTTDICRMVELDSMCSTTLVLDVLFGLAKEKASIFSLVL